MATPTLADEDEENEAENEPEDPEEEESVSETEPEENEEEETEEEQEDVEEVEMPEDDEEVESGEGGSLLGGSTFGISNKLLLGVGVAALLLVIAIQMNNSGPQNASRDRYESSDDVEAELEEGSEGAVQQQEDVMAAGGSQKRYDERQQEAAIDAVFAEG